MGTQIIDKNSNNISDHKNSRIGLIVAGSLGFAAVALVAVATPFILPALRKHCLPYVPATDIQLKNLSEALKKHIKPSASNSFIDIGSGDGRICRLAHQTGLFKETHGVELNSLLVLYSRAIALKHGQSKSMRFYRQNLWEFPLNKYDSVCVFGVESMMDSLEKYLRETSIKNQTIFACRFPFKNSKSLDEIGTGIDTVWIYKFKKNVNLEE